MISIGWVVAVILESLLLYKNTFSVFNLDDLKKDRLNTKDCAARVNRFLELENVAQALIAIELLISDGKWSGKWFSILMGFVHSLATIYLAYLYFSQKLRLKANHEAFDQISALRKTRRELLIFHFCGLLFIFFRFIESAVHHWVERTLHFPEFDRQES